MTVKFENFAFSYRKGGKPYFVPNDLGERIGKDIKKQVESVYKFDPFVFHLRGGGHVAALHVHRSHRFFARLDIRRFFYSIGRNRVQRTLAEIGIQRARHYAKWSCVKNPYGNPSYALPYGFVQSPILASLVLMESIVGTYIRGLLTEGKVQVSVYVDDISLSCDDLTELQKVFDGLMACLEEANFEVHPGKLRPPTCAMDLFNCDIGFGHTEVQQTRVEAFMAGAPSEKAMEAFAYYCLKVEEGNVVPLAETEAVETSL